jgi:hypothetical protein
MAREEGSGTLLVNVRVLAGGGGGSPEISDVCMGVDTVRVWCPPAGTGGATAELCCGIRRCEGAGVVPTLAAELCCGIRRCEGAGLTPTAVAELCCGIRRCCGGAGLTPKGAAGVTDA